LTRAEARQRAATEAQTSIQREKEGRAKLRGEREALVAVLVPVLLLGSSLWIGLLALANVRERRGEIGILRALGLQARQILLIFLGKAVVIGLGGAAFGYIVGWAIGTLWRDAPGAPPIQISFVDLRLLLLVLVATPVLAALACWLPAMSATQQDPAVVLREE
jgi:putative ABC transport system permease protein